jgi:hypothetical protein
MKHLISIAFICSFFCLKALGQSFAIIPNKTAEVSLSIPISDYEVTAIYVQNISANPLFLGWELLESTLLDNWDYSLCDLGQCYAGIPNGGTMNTIAPGDSGFLKMNFSPELTSGTGVVKFLVFNLDNNTEKDTVAFSYNIISTNISKAPNPYSFRFFPNPCREKLTFNNTSGDQMSIEIFDAMGAIKESITIPSGISFINVAQLSPGLYFIASSDGAVRNTLKLLITR